MVLISKKISFIFHFLLLCFYFPLQASLDPEEELGQGYVRQVSQLSLSLSKFTDAFPGSGNQTNAQYLQQGLNLIKDYCLCDTLDPKNYFDSYDEDLAEENWPEEERLLLNKIKSLVSNGLYINYKDEIQELETKIIRFQRNTERSYCPYQFSSHSNDPSLLFLVSATNKAIKDLIKMEEIANLARKAEITSDDFLAGGIRLACFFDKCSLCLLKGLEVVQKKGEKNWIRDKLSRSIIYSSGLAGYVNTKLLRHVESIIDTPQEISEEEITEGLERYGLKQTNRL